MLTGNGKKRRLPLFGYNFVPAVLLAAFALLLGACNRPTVESTTPTVGSVLETMVAATLTASSPRNPTRLPSSHTVTPAATATAASSTATLTPTATAAPNAATVSGKVCFPGEIIPAMQAYFEEIKTKDTVELSIAENQSQYEVSLPPGTYQAYAWLPDFSRGGLYSKAVPCGLKATCEDHQPLAFEVKAGESIEGINLCDWYAGPFNVPYPPGKEPGQLTGEISGGIAYPGGSAPGLHVVAFNVNTNNWYFVITNPGSSDYTLPQLPPGVYHVAAYDEQGRAGGHADANHDLIDVTVKAGEETTGVNINDWNAPAGTFPPDPSR